jgi:hypothetical protein
MNSKVVALCCVLVTDSPNKKRKKFVVLPLDDGALREFLAAQSETSGMGKIWFLKSRNLVLRPPFCFSRKISCSKFVKSFAMSRISIALAAVLAGISPFVPWLDFAASTQSIQQYVFEERGA